MIVSTAESIPMLSDFQALPKLKKKRRIRMNSRLDKFKNKNRAANFRKLNIESQRKTYSKYRIKILRLIEMRLKSIHAKTRKSIKLLAKNILVKILKLLERPLEITFRRILINARKL